MWDYVRVIYAVDVGKTREPPNFAWARVGSEGDRDIIASSDIRILISRLEHDFKRGHSVALGFEAPVFIPIPESADDLSRGRKGEGSRSCFAPAGSTVAMLGVHQAAWMLRMLSGSCGNACTFTLDWKEWSPTASEQVFFCWEAFVSGDAHGTSHAQDAATAAMEFLRHEHALAAVNAVTTSRPFSLIGAAALWSGWTSNLDILHEPTLVIKPTEPYRGPIHNV